ncbi:GntR family transcriptional regulator [Roseomonas sp. CCTCC AB2023176]|uniref:GntR family transcriptional regulator n=1 Tax=Roseomonas sp. CCTCC AB2023176 TaxID=3342640 RepID=UPI0035D71C0B
MAYRKPDADGRSAVEQAADRLRAAIGRGDFAPGQRLVAADLEDQLAAGANTVREALRLLAGEGVIALEAHRGAVVRRLDASEIAEIWEMREAIEGMAARLAARRVAAGTPWPELDAALAAGARAVAAGEAAAYYAANATFHDAVLALSGRARFIEAARRLSLPVNRMLFGRLLRPEAMRVSQAGHEALTAAIGRGEDEAAEAIMRQHIREAAVEIAGTPSN